MQTMADKDGSGSIDRQEFRDHVSPTGNWPNSDAAFDRADADGNSQLSPDEIVASFGINTSAWPGLQDVLQNGKWTKDDLGRFLAAADADGDGVVSVSECSKLHQHLDQNSDGRVSTDELQDTFRLFDADGNGFLEDTEISKLLAGMSANQVHTFMQEADHNRDGRVSSTEFLDFVKRYDADNDGTLSAAEWSRALKEPQANVWLEKLLYVAQRKLVDPHMANATVPSRLLYKVVAAGLRSKIAGGSLMQGVCNEALNAAVYDAALPKLATVAGAALGWGPPRPHDAVPPPSGRCICGADPRITLRPCGHRVLCARCYARMVDAELARCPHCGRHIEV